MNVGLNIQSADASTLLVNSLQAVSVNCARQKWTATDEQIAHNRVTGRSGALAMGLPRIDAHSPATQPQRAMALWFTHAAIVQPTIVETGCQARTPAGWLAMPGEKDTQPSPPTKNHLAKVNTRAYSPCKFLVGFKKSALVDWKSGQRSPENFWPAVFRNRPLEGVSQG